LASHRNRIVGPLPDGVDERRGRFDRVGHTIYFASSQEAAFAKVLSVLRKDLVKLEPLAQSAGMKVSDWVESVLADAEANSIDVPWAISVDWQMQRSIGRYRMPAFGYWVQVDHPDTLDWLNREFLGLLSANGAEIDDALNGGHLERSDRAVTTLISEFISQSTLFDGSLPLGVSFQIQNTSRPVLCVFRPPRR